jgi:hypothetical protein
MTNREMAIELADCINRHLRRIAALESILDRHEIPHWKEDALTIVHEPFYLRISESDIRLLQYAIGDDTPEAELIQTLYRHFVQ